MGVDYTAHSFIGLTWGEDDTWPEILQGYNANEPSASDCEPGNLEKIEAALEAHGLEFKRFGDSYSGEYDTALLVSESLHSVGGAGVSYKCAETNVNWAPRILAFCADLGFFGPELENRVGRHTALDIW